MMHLNKILSYALGPIGAGILSLISLPMMTWFYSVEDIGRISMLQVFTSFAVLFFSLGLDQAYVREYHETDHKDQLLKTLVVPSIIFFGFSAVLLLICQPKILSTWLYGVPSVYLSLITVACFFAALLTRFLSLVLRMQDRALAFSISQLLPKLLLLICVVAVFLFNIPRDTFNLISINVLSVFSAFLFYALSTRADWLPSFHQKIETEQLKQYLLFGLPLLIGALASWALNLSDRLFLRHFANYTELGVYSVAMSLAGVVTIIATIFNTIWAPMVYKWVSHGEVDYNKIDEISEYLLMAIFFLSTFAGMFAWIIPFFLPPEYINVEHLIVACIVGPLFYTLSETTAIGITIVRKTTLLMMASIVAMLINLLGNYILVPMLGSAGSAISFAVSFWFFFMIRTEFSRMVWRNIPTHKMYVVSLLILVLAILNIFDFMGVMPSMVIWFVVFLLGIGMFRQSIDRLWGLMKKHV